MLLVLTNQTTSRCTHVPALWFAGSCYWTMQYNWYLSTRLCIVTGSSIPDFTLLLYQKKAHPRSPLFLIFVPMRTLTPITSLRLFDKVLPNVDTI